MPVLPFTRTQLRKRHPGLKKKNNSDLDHAIERVSTLSYAHYLLNGSRGHNSPDAIKVSLSRLDEPAKAALIDYFARIKEIVESA